MLVSRMIEPEFEWYWVVLWRYFADANQNKWLNDSPIIVTVFHRELLGNDIWMYIIYMIYIYIQ